MAALNCYFDFAVAEDEDSVFFLGDLQMSLEEAKEMEEAKRNGEERKEEMGYFGKMCEDKNGK